MTRDRKSEQDGEGYRQPGATLPKHSGEELGRHEGRGDHGEDVHHLLRNLSSGGEGGGKLVGVGLRFGRVQGNVDNNDSNKHGNNNVGVAYVHSVLLLVDPVLVEAAAPRRHPQGLLL